MGMTPALLHEMDEIAAVLCDLVESARSERAEYTTALSLLDAVSQAEFSRRPLSNEMVGALIAAALAALGRRERAALVDRIALVARELGR